MLTRCSDSAQHRLPAPDVGAFMTQACLARGWRSRSWRGTGRARGTGWSYFFFCHVSFFFCRYGAGQRYTEHYDTPTTGPELEQARDRPRLPRDCTRLAGSNLESRGRCVRGRERAVFGVGAARGARSSPITLHPSQMAGFSSHHREELEQAGHAADPGLRLATVLVYLTSLASGGQIEFEFGAQY